MNTDYYFVGVIVFLITLLVSRKMSDRATKKLSPEQRDQLYGSFSGQSIRYIGLVIVLFGAYYGLIKMEVVHPKTGFILYLVLALLMIFGINLITYRKLKTLGLPNEYLKSYLTSSAIRTLGIVTMFATILVE